MRTPLFSYNQRKHVEEHGFPLIIEILLLPDLLSCNQQKSQRVGIFCVSIIVTMVTVTSVAKEKRTILLH